MYYGLSQGCFTVFQISYFCIFFSRHIHHIDSSGLLLRVKQKHCVVSGVSLLLLLLLCK